MRPWVAEISAHAVAHVFRDKPIKASDHVGDGAVIGGDDLAQILWIKASGEFGRADEITEHHRELPSLCTRRRQAIGGGCGALYRHRGTIVVSGLIAQCGDGGQQFSAVTD